LSRKKLGGDLSCLLTALTVAFVGNGIVSMATGTPFRVEHPALRGYDAWLTPKPYWAYTVLA